MRPDDASRYTGFPSPADFAERSLNLHALAVTHPEATFFWTARGDGMEGAGIYSGDVLVVDRSLDPNSHDVVVVVLQGEYLVRRWHLTSEGLVLSAEHPGYPDLIITDNSCTCWGVVVWVLHNPNRKRR